MNTGINMDNIGIIISAIWEWFGVIWNIYIVRPVYGPSPWYEMQKPGVTIGNIATMIIIIEIIAFVIQTFYKHKGGDMGDGD